MNGKSKPGRPRLADPRTHRYNFKLNDEENIRFCRMLTLIIHLSKCGRKDII